ncbi:cytochrome P450 [Corynebacterium sp.]|uniref:cytochrome P450 n=1 Tax=Corynebacterium sp. TaxID=1720 RepID=UPI0025BB6BD7|nr:cytochrome P450 [Corynebacterium sp.]
MSDLDNPTLLCDEALNDPYPIYRRMREHGCVYHDLIADAWCVLDLDLVRTVLQDSTGFSSHHLADRAEPVLGARVLAQMTGAEHTEKKAVTMHGLATVAMDGYHLPAVETAVTNLWERVKDAECLDLVEEPAGPSATNVTCELLGIDAQWKHKVLPWNRSVVQFITLLQQTPDERSQRLADAGYFRASMLRLIKTRRRSPRHDLVSYLVYETLRSPTLEESVTTGTGKITEFPTETLRLHPPVQIIPRIAVGKQVLGGHSIPDGSTVYCLTGAAHRDPSFFPEPDKFILSRKENSVRSAFPPSAEHLAFGSGRHFCIGAMLARRQLETAFRASLSHFPEWRLAADPLTEHGLYTRGPSHLLPEKSI